MAASVLYRQRNSGLGMDMEENDCDVRMFFGVHRSDMGETDLVQNSGDFYDQKGRQHDSSVTEIKPTLPGSNMGVDEFLNFENDKADYDWY